MKTLCWITLSLCLSLPLGAQEDATAILTTPTASSFSAQLYRRGSEKKELLFTLKAERNAELWTDHYFDAHGADAVIERVFLKEGQPQRYEFDDRQQQGLGVLEVQGKKLKLSWTQDGKTSVKETQAPDNLTFGPLYPRLLRSRFAELLAGKVVLGTVPVLSQSRLMTAELAFQRKPKLERGDGSICISMQPANWFVALFFPPIDLTFDEKTQVLLDVHGTCLLKEKIKGEWELTKVDLYYQY